MPCIDGRDVLKGVWLAKVGYYQLHTPMKNGKRRKLLAHRHIYEQCFGTIKRGNVILHLCDNPKCVNPEHLRQGTQAENVRDMDRKGRRVSVPRWKLTKDQFDDIRSRPKTQTNVSIAKEFGIGDSHVSRIRRGIQCSP